MSDILDRLRGYADSRLYALPGQYVCDVPEILNEHAELVTRLRTAERERDEARKCLAAEEEENAVSEALLTKAISERDEARRALESLKIDHADALDAYRQMYESERNRAERAEAEAEYIRRAFRGAVESDALAVTYKTVGSYRAGILKTINALDTTEPTP